MQVGKDQNHCRQLTIIFMLLLKETFYGFYKRYQTMSHEHDNWDYSNNNNNNSISILIEKE